MHMAAAGADRTPEPVRSFGTSRPIYIGWSIGLPNVVSRPSTGMHWIPTFELLDARGFAVFLVNARDAKHVPRVHLGI